MMDNPTQHYQTPSLVELFLWVTIPKTIYYIKYFFRQIKYPEHLEKNII